jgi:hypothetical protein
MRPKLLSCQTRLARKGRTWKGFQMRRFRANVLLALTLLVAACSVQVPTATDAVVYVIRRDWHTDIGLPVDEIIGPLARLESAFPGVRFLTFGFGERQFLIDRKSDVFTMLGALLPSQSALLMTALNAPPEQAFGVQNVTVLHVSRAGIDRLEAAIWQELELSIAEQPIILADGPYPGSLFYAARNLYWGLYTCNTWTAEMLRAGGVAMPSTGVLFAGQVMGMAAWIAAHESPNRP